jgi:hypothetical protein
VKKNDQIRGICQVCGAEWAVRGVERGADRMSQHGYTIVGGRGGGGWFNGVCYGQHHRPLQLDRSECDRTIASIEASLPGLAAKLAGLRDGSVLPEKADGDKWIESRWIGRHRVPGTGCHERIPFAQADKRRQDAAVREAIASTENRIEAGKAHVKTLRELIVEYHGKPLRTVEKKASGPKMHLGGGFYGGAVCAASAMGSQRINNWTDDRKVFDKHPNKCAKCEKDAAHVHKVVAERKALRAAQKAGGR